MQSGHVLRAAVVFGLLAPAAAEAQSEAVSGLDRYVSDAMRIWQVPGVSIAIVRNDSVILARGYGVLQVGQPALVTGHTVFAIASLTSHSRRRQPGSWWTVAQLAGTR